MFQEQKKIIKKHNLFFTKVVFFFVLFLSLNCTAHSSDFKIIYDDKPAFDKAIYAAKSIEPIKEGMTGVTVPHHLLAADLIAKGFKYASKGQYKNIIIIAPDHFRKTTKPFATTTKNFETIFGKVTTNSSFTEDLISKNHLFQESELFQKEHSIRALLPFIRFYFPKAKIIPIVIGRQSTRKDWDEVIILLTKFLSKQTLVVQSTDFSHFLPYHLAIQRDQEVINTLTSGDIKSILRLKQPDHLDSVGAQYIQSKIQKEYLNANLEIAAHKNSQFYFDSPLKETTSYILQLYLKKNLTNNRLDLKNNDFKSLFFAGDTLVGRELTTFLTDKKNRKKFTDYVIGITQGQPLIVNLEGVILEDIPQNLKFKAMTMSSSLTVPLFKQLNIIAVSLANNHSNDLGILAYKSMKNTLETAGIKTIEHGRITDLGDIRILGLTDINNKDPYRKNFIKPDILNSRLIKQAKPPVFTFIHWGQEFRLDISKREKYLIELLRNRAISAIVGHHPHAANKKIIFYRDREFPIVFSLGNFLFDQANVMNSGAILEVRIFPSRISFLKIHQIKNIIDIIGNKSLLDKK
ncbi:hypothetical protein NBRC116602_29850 [Hyphomicrobiales bacterium 4NK60-0047b]